MAEAEERKYSFRSCKEIIQALAERLNVNENDDDAFDAPCSDDSGDEFVVFNNKISDSDSAEERGEEEEQKQQDDDDDDIEREAECANKQKLIDTVERQQSRGRSRKNVPAAASHWIWSEKESDRRDRRSSGIFQNDPFPKNDAKNIRSPLQAFNILFSDNLIDKIVKHTNEQIACEVKKKKRIIQSYHSLTDKTEINAFIGISYYTAVLKQNNSRIGDMWSEEFGCGIYRAAFSKYRFNFLSSMIRFDDKTTRRKRQFIDKLAPVREIWEIFMQNCTSSYEPSSDCTIDEQLVSFSGKGSFRIYTKNKLDKYGLKILMLNDAKTLYMISAIPYVGMVTPEENDSVPTYFVRKLVELGSLTGSWRTITMGNWFTSVPLFMLLKEKYQLRAVGTIKKNKKEIPTTLKTASAVGSSRFVFTNDLTLVSYVPKKNKIVLLLSSIHHNSKVDRSTGKPEIIFYYNANKGATDAFDQKCHAFSVVRHTQRWPLKFFYNMLNQASINGCILYNLIALNERLTSPNFMKNLAFALIEPQLQQRLKIKTLSMTTSRLIAKLLKVDEPVVQGYNILKEKSRRTCACALQNR